MNYTDTLINQYSDPAVQTAMKAYFCELGLNITNWDGLFQEMEQDGANFTFIRKDETGDVTGFIQFTTMDMSSWFFSAKCGFIREFWIRRDLRCQGYGTALLNQAEEWLRKQGCLCILLTTDTAPDFYKKHGYRHEPGIQARNKDKVYVKRL